MPRSGWLAVWLLLAAVPSAGGQAPMQAPSPAPPAASAASLDALVGRTIADIRLTIEGQENRDPELRAVLETAVGAALTTAAVRESLIHLMALARFEDVTVDAALTPTGVVLTYHLKAVHTVKSVAFRGDLGLPVGQLRKAVEERYTSSPPVTRAEEIAEMLDGLLRDHGFLKATVTPATEATNRADRILLVF